jgi:hypothetical protein
MRGVMRIGREQLGGAHDAERAILFGTDGVLPALAAGDGEERHVRIQAARKIGEQAGGFIVRVGGDVQNSRSDARFVDGLDGFLHGLRASSREGGQHGRRGAGNGKRGGLD